MLEPLHITIREIPHREQSYSTVGNWTQLPNGTWLILVSNMGDWRYALLVAVHELCEMALCVHRGITDAAVTQFDLDFEARRAPGNLDEPGHDPAAPYQREHIFAESVERQLAEQLDVQWDTYDHKVAEMP